MKSKQLNIFSIFDLNRKVSPSSGPYFRDIFLQHYTNSHVDHQIVSSVCIK